MAPHPAPDITQIAARKRDHLELALAERSQHGVPAGWNDVHLVPAAVPVGSLDDVDLTTSLLGRTLRAPILLAGMTGGHDDASELNAVLGAAAQRLGLAVGVGSQRAALADPRAARSFAAVRDRAPDAMVLANVGMCQLVPQGRDPGLSAADVLALVDMVGADALAVHLNVVQEIVQTEGDRNFGHLAEAIATLVERSPVPVVAKETGAGVPIIATGGVRDGLDAAKALALGATAVGLGRPAMLAAQRGEAALVSMLEDLIDDLRVALLLTGCARPADLDPPVLSGFTLEWARQRQLLPG